MDNSREYDVVLWGATGFTGRLVLTHLLRRRTGDLRLAIAGRNREKLEAIRAQSGHPELPVLVGDGRDRKFLDQLARCARVVCTTVGPYARYGSELVEACANGGTGYCDLTGEVPWIRRMIDQHGATAERTGARLVHSCGFDSIPADLGVWFVQELAREQLGGPCDHVRARVKDVRGAVSGGTVASFENLLADARRDPEVRRLLRDPYALNPEGERKGPDEPDPLTPERDPDFGWTAPFIMAAANSRIVRRTNAVLGYPYGRDFRYEEAIATGKGPRGLLAATAVATATGALLASLSIPMLRDLTARFRPAPGEGPSADQREAGRFTYALLGTRGDQRVRATVIAEVDPGYGATSRMLAESALCLAEDADRLPVQGGSWTPAAAMGSRLLQRLNEVGIVFSGDVVAS